MINLSMPETDNMMKPRIVVFGVGGAGTNAINNMIRLGLEGIEFVAANTDAQALASNLAGRKLQLGVTVTRGLGAGARPDVGREAAEEQLDEINALLEGAHMAFITAGMGGGTGTGAAPVIARAARERGILTVGVVTKPFQFEGAVRSRSAEAGIQALQQYVDTLIVIPNQNLFNIANEKTTFADAFKMADDVLYQGVRGVTDLIMTPGQINLDFADIRSVMSEMGKAMMGTGEAEGDNRARQAAEMAINNPLLDDASVKGARGVLINITGGPDLTLFEVEEAADRIRDEVDQDANIIFGTALDESMSGRIRISVVATGIDLQVGRQRPPLEVVGGTSGAQNMGGLPQQPVMPTAWPAQPAATAPQQQRNVAMGGLFTQAAPQTAQSLPQQQTATATRATAPQQPVQQQSVNFYSGMMPEQQGNTLRAPQPLSQPMSQTMPQMMPQQPMMQEQVRARSEAAPAPVRGTRQGSQFVAPAPAQPPRSQQAPQHPMMQAPLQPTLATPAAPTQQRKPGFGQRMLGKLKKALETTDETAQQGVALPPPRSDYQVTQGGKAGLPPVEDPEIDIPAFLRRQAN